MAALSPELLARHVRRRARALGATLVRIAPAARWDEQGEVPRGYRPRDLWSQAESVIVLGLPILLPVIDTTPSIHYQEQYDTTNRLLDGIAYQLAVQLTERGHASVSIPRDGYGGLDVLLRNPFAFFSHVMAAKYAGLGALGLSHNLVTPEYGPRVRLVSVFTAAPLPPDAMVDQDPCGGCDACARACPVSALAKRPGEVVGDLDKDACTRHHQVLKDEARWPCGVCIKVCPVGRDRRVFGQRSIRPHLEERRALAEDPGDPRYAALVHIRRHGSRGDRIA
ncbi:MAG TPA: 4Fe-4S dicluster domain-containing protein [Anaeromyxobacteraceae bacterium]|nr:4Fe-4S dicluster domain-containing protein [Anaeromyxobacteraceae bacterium]